MQKLVKKIRRFGKTITAEVVEIGKFKFDPTLEFHVDSKDFNSFKGIFLQKDPTQETYDKANKWADELIELHLKNS